MLISKFDLCKSEWLELVFAKRNKEYGAYYLRQHYAGNIVKAMFITFTTVTALFFTAGILMGHKPTDIFRRIDVPLQQIQPPPVPPKKEEVHSMRKSAPPKPPVSTVKVVPPVVTDKPVDDDPPKLIEIAGKAIGSETVKVPGGEGKPAPIESGEGNGGTGTKIDENQPYDVNGIDVQPEPVGGAAAWSKFLQKNLRYPGEAIDKGISGKVYVSFIVEKNGSLSSFAVVRGAGYGMDEEAMRVLKKAPAWKPGMQNGQPVRVKYVLPLNFVLSNQDN